MTERELRALAAFVDFPAERDLAPAIRARLGRQPRRRRALVLILAAALLAIALAFAVTPARSAILRFFHLQGVTIEYVDKLPSVRVSEPFDLGRPIELSEAERVAGFRPLTSPLLGTPDQVSWDGEMLWFRYGGHGSVRVLVSEFRGSRITTLVKKVVQRGTEIYPVIVDHEQGYFIKGAEHFLYLAPTDIVRDERVRLARNVLLWEHGALTMRLEGALGIEQAMEIARSFK
jgi:hypothetical protein